MGLLKSINVSLTDGQLIKLANGKRILLKHEQVRDDGCHCLKLKSRKHTRVTKHKAQGKGTRLQLDDDEIDGTGLWDWLKEKGKQISDKIKIFYNALDPKVIYDTMMTLLQDKLDEIINICKALDEFLGVNVGDMLRDLIDMLKQFAGKIIEFFTELFNKIKSKITGGALGGDDEPEEEEEKGNWFINKIKDALSLLYEVIRYLYKDLFVNGFLRNWVVTPLFLRFKGKKSVDELDATEKQYLDRWVNFVEVLVWLLIFIALYYKFVYGTPYASKLRIWFKKFLTKIVDAYIEAFQLPTNLEDGLKGVAHKIINFFLNPSGLAGYVTGEIGEGLKSPTIKTMSTWKEHFGAGMRGKKFASRAEANEHVRKLSAEWKQARGGMEAPNTPEAISRNERRRERGAIGSVRGGMEAPDTPEAISRNKGRKDRGVIGSVRGAGPIGGVTYSAEGLYVVGSYPYPPFKKTRIGPFPTESIAQAVADVMDRAGQKTIGGSSEILLSPGLGSTAPKIIKKKKGRA